MSYRKEIDGLRAVAVVAVMFFHAQFPLFNGGFVGVDIFFVISGYLITQIIITEVNSGSFSVIRFYDRRIRRILPALYAMMFICLPVAWLVLVNPTDFKDFCKSVLAIPLSVSNILFWRESGYFDITTALKPLLHTWSLAVEEQYYLLFPVYLLVTWKWSPKISFWLIIFLGVLSIAFAQWGSIHQPVFNFYWLPARIWELFAGALIPIFYSVFRAPASMPSLAWRSGLRAETLGVVGLVLIFSSIFLMDERMRWPSAWTVIPVSGTVLILLFTSHLTWVGRLLSFRPLVVIGLMSYSAYLWHQPLLAFARYQFDTLSWGFRLALVLSAFAFGWLSWRFIEKPFRDKNRFTSKQIFISALACSVFFVSVGLTGYLRSGFLFQLSTKDQPAFSYVMKTFMQDIRGDRCFIQGFDLAGTYGQECSTTAKPEQAVLLWGDSYAAALYLGLKAEYGEVMQFTAGGCAPIFGDAQERIGCKTLNESVMKEIERHKPKTIYLAANWFAYTFDNIAAKNAVRQIREWIPGVDIVLIGNVPHWAKSLPREVLQSVNSFDRELYLPVSKFSELKDSDHQLDVFAREQAIEFISALNLLCTNQECLAITMSGEGPRLTSFDYGHLTKAGSETLIQDIVTKKDVVVNR